MDDWLSTLKIRVLRGMMHLPTHWQRPSCFRSAAPGRIARDDLPAHLLEFRSSCTGSASDECRRHRAAAQRRA